MLSWRSKIREIDFPPTGPSSYTFVKFVVEKEKSVTWNYCEHSWVFDKSRGQKKEMWIENYLTTGAIPAVRFYVRLSSPTPPWSSVSTDKVIVKDGHKLIINNGSDGVEIMENFEVEKGAVFEIK